MRSDESTMERIVESTASLHLGVDPLRARSQLGAGAFIGTPYGRRSTPFTAVFQQGLFR